MCFLERVFHISLQSLEITHSGTPIGRSKFKNSWEQVLEIQGTAQFHLQHKRLMIQRDQRLEVHKFLFCITQYLCSVP
jgi:hypothetical protein